MQKIAYNTYLVGYVLYICVVYMCCILAHVPDFAVEKDEKEVVGGGGWVVIWWWALTHSLPNSLAPPPKGM